MKIGFAMSLMSSAVSTEEGTRMASYIKELFIFFVKTDVFVEYLYTHCRFECVLACEQLFLE